MAAMSSFETALSEWTPLPSKLKSGTCGASRKASVGPYATFPESRHFSVTGDRGRPLALRRTVGVLACVWVTRFERCRCHAPMQGLAPVADGT